MKLRSKGYSKRQRENVSRLKNSDDTLPSIFAQGRGQETDTESKVILDLQSSNDKTTPIQWTAGVSTVAVRIAETTLVARTPWIGKILSLNFSPG